MTPLSYVEVDAGALRHNLAALKRLVREGEAAEPGTWVPEYAAVVKANAYGHGLEETVRALEGRVDAFQVDDLDELRRLRRLTAAKALVFGHVRPQDVAEATRLDAEIVVYREDQLAALRDARDRHDDAKGEFSVKVDALLGRLGILPDEAEAFAATVARLGLEPVAAYAHYANIEDTTDLGHADAQQAAFLRAYRVLARCWPRMGHHISATSGLLAKERPQGGSTLLRLGIGLYGLYPSAPLARSHAHLGLRPAMRWVTHLAQVKTLPAGHPVGYGLTYRTARPTTLGIVPQGYSDGYDRGLSNVGEVLVRGRRCPVVGRVAMNMFAVDLTPAPDARAEDEAVLLGAQGEERITAEEIAAKLGTINYEVVARVSPLLPRVAV